MPYYDGDFSKPQPLPGDGLRVFSEFNTADFIVTRYFAILASVYKPLPISTPDAQYPRAYLIEESEEQREGGLVYVRRLFATVPSLRSEHQEVAFVFPGESAVVSTTVNGKPVKRWDRYGRKRTASVYREALVEISYSLGAPATSLPTQIAFDGQVVDFVGRVYSDDGEKFLGSTVPLIAPSTFVMSDVARRWRGDIWERTRITVSRTGGASVIVP